MCRVVGKCCCLRGNNLPSFFSLTFTISYFFIFWPLGRNQQLAGSHLGVGFMVNCPVECICGLFMGRGKYCSLWCIALVRKSISEYRDRKIKRIYFVPYMHISIYSNLNWILCITYKWINICFFA